MDNERIVETETTETGLNSKYMDSVHRDGTIWNIAVMIILLLFPVAVGLIFQAVPDWAAVGKGLLATAPMYWAVGVVEVITFIPMLGAGGSYLSFVTGNISNLKLPCALNALENAEVKAQSEEGEIVSTIAIAVSSIVTTLFAEGEHDKFEIFAVMHCHEMEVCNESKLLADYNEYLPAPDMDYSQAFDYIIRKYAEECRALEFDTTSKWYGFEGGKPVKIVLCTHWHDARPLYNGAVRRLVEKWSDCAYLCAFDANIGFTKDEPDPETGEQMSLRYAKNGINDTEYLYGVLHGWHPTRGRDAEIQQRMAKIFADACVPLVERK